MKHFLYLGLLFFSGTVQAQSLITMSNKCYKLVQAGNALNESGDYSKALETFDKVLRKCSAKDAKEQGNTGRAKALNGLKRYDEAVAAADLAISASNEMGIAAYFEKAEAHYALQQLSAAADDYAKIISLSDKNRNAVDRATMYAKLADLDWKLQHRDKAFTHIDMAIDIDQSNPAYLIQKADYKLKLGDLKPAFALYEEATTLSNDKQSMYKMRAFAFTRAMQEKYSTRDAKELGAKMSSEEKKQFCLEWKQLFDTGYKDVQQDLYYTLICL
ncbi:MAG TPA: hypothetical protein PLQ32_03455 [Flavihumibacter sp.]|nr:hypothetical protein [Flavihumibacter sp.]